MHTPIAGKLPCGKRILQHVQVNCIDGHPEDICRWPSSYIISPLRDMGEQPVSMQ
jgi:hypothetical protein